MGSGFVNLWHLTLRGVGLSGFSGVSRSGLSFDLISFLRSSEFQKRWISLPPKRQAGTALCCRRSMASMVLAPTPKSGHPNRDKKGCQQGLCLPRPRTRKGTKHEPSSAPCPVECRILSSPACPTRCARTLRCWQRREAIGRFRLDVGLSPSSWAVVSDVVRVPFLPQVESPKPPYPKAQDYRSYTATSPSPEPPKSPKLLGIRSLPFQKTDKTLRRH